MKNKEEIEKIKQDVISLQEKLKELSEDELKEVTGGDDIDIEIFNHWEILPTINSFNNCEFENNKSKSEGGALDCINSSASAANN